MLKKNEYQILKILFEDFTTDISIKKISEKLNQKYPQTHKIIKGLEKKELINTNKIGSAKVIKLNFKKCNLEYVTVEMERFSEKKDKTLKNIQETLLNVEYNFACILFGSYAKGASTKNSDMDLLFIINDDINRDKFERVIKNQLSLYNADINIIKKLDLKEMWLSKTINVWNEIEKNHYVITGYEQFINTLKTKNGY
jgi:predicted nucleotidyltransferase